MTPERLREIADYLQIESETREPSRSGKILANLCSEMAADLRSAADEWEKEQNELWLEFNTPDNLCGLCGNRGRIVHTDKSPAGVETIIVDRPCICPNGRAIKKQSAYLQHEEQEHDARQD
ncbi:MAG TPA: hypothetical protein PKA76_19515 [Pirellulaceae bacterium]|nr:hypothetical protein [Pirellulaceae bacterium]